MKPYQSIPIIECGEELVRIPEVFAFSEPHVYESLGAPYANNLSPFYLRQGVISCLEKSLAYLQKKHPYWRIKIFDAYRPVAVQQFMVNYTTQELAKEKGWEWHNLSLSQARELEDAVKQFWAMPSFDLATPPPHSTGAAVDVTLVDQNNCEIDMGGAIDELSPRSYPNYFEQAESPEELKFHTNRRSLFECMTSSGFQQHPNEWWHFSFGDQMWAWLTIQNNQSLNPLLKESMCKAKYGRYREFG